MREDMTGVRVCLDPCNGVFAWRAGAQCGAVFALRLDEDCTIAPYAACDDSRSARAGDWLWVDDNGTLHVATDETFRQNFTPAGTWS